MLSRLVGFQWKLAQIKTGQRNLLKKRNYAAGAKAKDTTLIEDVDIKTTAPVNILKDGTHPLLKNRSEYPEWLSSLITPSKTLSELDQQSEETGFDEMELHEQRALLKLVNRSRIKEANSERSKK